MQELKTLNPDLALTNRPRFISAARLMSPEEVAAATQDRDAKVRDWHKGLWMLCGDVHRTMFDLLAGVTRPIFAARISAFTAPLQFKYGILTTQAGPHQHRFIFPLWDPLSTRLVKEMSRGNVGFMLGREHEDQALLVPCTIEPAFVAPLLNICRTPQAELVPSLLAELPIAVSTLGQLDSIPSLYEGQTVEEVSASLLMPTAALQVYEELHAHPAAMTTH